MIVFVRVITVGVMQVGMPIGSGCFVAVAWQILNTDRNGDTEQQCGGEFASVVIVEGDFGQ